MATFIMSVNGTATAYNTRHALESAVDAERDTRRRRGEGCVIKWTPTPYGGYIALFM